MVKRYEGKEFEALKMRYDDQVGLLRFMTTFDFQIFGGFITLQAAVGSWLAAHPIASAWAQIGILVIDAVAALVSLKLLHNQYARRREVQATLANVNEALGFNEPGVYVEGKALNPAYTPRLWFKWYVVGIITSYIGMLLISLWQVMPHNISVNTDALRRPPAAPAPFASRRLPLR